MDTTSLTTEPLHRGAEAELLRSKVDSWSAVVKRRVKKQYRDESLDSSLRRERTLTEAFIMHEAKTAGVRVPSIIGLDMETNTILMTHVNGTVARDSLDEITLKEAERLFR
ncbi:MAG TPA: hypothetical protein VE955_00290, partial [Candidatus Dormibacteraeota bacterium]|nr:hypothetical protein [Candidatus Dormibacteraeota bacterium]